MNRVRKIRAIVFILILGIPILLLAELLPDFSIEELEKKLQTVSGKDKVDVLIKLAGAHWYISAEKIIEYATQAMDLSKKLGYRGGEAVCLGQLAHAYNIKGDFDTAFEYAHKSLEIHEKDVDDLANKTSILSTLSAIQFKQENYETGIEYAQRALRLAEKVGNKSHISVLLRNIGMAYFSLKKYDLALEFFEKASNAAKGLEDQRVLAMIYEGMAFVYHDKGELEKTLDSLLKGLEIVRKMNDNIVTVSFLNNAGEIYNDLHNYEKAQQYLEEGLALARELDAKYSMFALYENLSKLFEAQKDYKKALDHYKLYHETQNEVFNEKKNQEIADLQVKYETAKKEKEIEIKELALTRQKTIRNFLAGIAGLVLVLALVTYNRYRFKAKTNKELTSLNELIRKENQAKDKLFSIIAHDLSSPLNGLLFCSEYLKNNFIILEKEKVKEVLDELAEYTINISDLLKNLLRWAVSQLREISCNPRKTDLNLLIGEVMRLHAITARKKKIRLHSQIEPDTVIYADEDMMKTVIGNLLNNAIKFTHEGGEVKVSSKKAGDRVQVQVADNGVGISEDKIDKIFKMDVHKITRGTAEEKGAGLGLVLSKEFTEKNGGKIWVQSEENKGSCFHLEIPADKGAEK